MHLSQHPPAPAPLSGAPSVERAERHWRAGGFGCNGKSTETVAVLEATTAYKLNGSLPVVGTNTGVFAAIGKPVVVVTPAPPMKAAALALGTSTATEHGHGG